MTNWKQIRQQVLERDKYTCKECGNSLKSLEVHHIIPLRQGSTDELDNLITVCSKCHRIIEPIRHPYGVTGPKRNCKVKLFQAQPRSNSLRVSVPKSIQMHMKLKLGDVIYWTFEIIKGKMVAVVRKKKEIIN